MTRRDPIGKGKKASGSSAGAQHRGHRGVIEPARGLADTTYAGGDGPVLTDCRLWVVSIPGGWELADSGSSSIRNRVDSPKGTARALDCPRGPV